jgi:hypothetical protein
LAGRALAGSCRWPGALVISAVNGGEQEPVSLTAAKLPDGHSGPACVVSPGSSGWPETAMAPASVIRAV